MAYEELEALRWAPFVRPNGAVIVNVQRVAPAPVALGVAVYPDDPIGRLRDVFADTKIVEANALALNAGNARAANIVMLGALAAGLAFDKEQWIQTITRRVPEKTLAINLKAFNAGWEV